jgi:hypothetical protein
MVTYISTRDPKHHKANFRCVNQFDLKIGQDAFSVPDADAWIDRWDDAHFDGAKLLIKWREGHEKLSPKKEK